MDGTTHANGNSLFGEVDDRRINVERQMISLKIKHESLERTHATTKQQLKKMKVYICACIIIIMMHTDSPSSDHDKLHAPLSPS